MSFPAPSCLNGRRQPEKGEITVTTITEQAVATQTYKVYIKASSEAVWDAITSADETERYGYRSRSEDELQAGGAFQGYANEGMRAMGSPEVVVDGEVLEAEAPHLLVQTWSPHFDLATSAEPATRLTWEIDRAGNGVTRLSVTHELDDAPLTAQLVGGFMANTGGGWAMVLSDLKSLLETGEPLTDDGLVDMGC
jgi:uncharacterized protein YndB with AHSA1/START domain